jgi:hypothetical protein
LARAKLAQLYPDGGGALYTALINDLLARAQGNPFFLEELLNYLRDQGIEPHELATAVGWNCPTACTPLF